MAELHGTLKKLHCQYCGKEYRCKEYINRDYYYSCGGIPVTAFQYAKEESEKAELFVYAKTGRHPGYPILIKTVENRMKRLLKLAGLNKLLSPHSPRHTHTSFLAESDKVSLEEIMKRLGHTDDIYYSTCLSPCDKSNE